MNEILRRRRDIIGSPKRGLLFHKTSIEMLAGECLDTGIEILQEDLSVTVLLDYTSTNNPTTSGSPGNIYKLLQMGTTRELCIGKYNGTDSELSIWWMPSSNADRSVLTGVTATPGRKRIAVIHEANSNNITVYAKMDNGTLYTFTKTKTFSPTNKKLSVGYVASTTTQAGVPSGTLNVISVYNRILRSEEINTFFK